MKLKEYFELEDRLKKIEEIINYAYGMINEWDNKQVSDEKKNMVLTELRKNKQEAEKLKIQIDKVRLELLKENIL